MPTEKKDFFGSCECSCWARCGDEFLQTHHPRCERSPESRAADLMNLVSRLAEGIQRWAAEEDGVPDYLHADYEWAREVTGRTRPSGSTEQGNAPGV